MEQLALSTAATADLLAGMAANSSHAHASDFILAASATLQAFARAAQSTQNQFVGQHGGGAADPRLLTSSTSGLGAVPEQQRQQLAYMQQLQQQQQQGAGLGVNQQGGWSKCAYHYSVSKPPSS